MGVFMKIAITTETTVDLTPDLLEKFDIKTIPIFVRLGDEELPDGSFPCSQIFDFVKKTKQLPKTSAINSEIYKEFFAEILKDYDAIIHLGLSSGISSTCINAKKAAEEFENVFVIDTLSLSTGVALNCIYVRKLINEGLEPKEIVEKCEARIPFNQTSFVLQEHNYLYKGGRCNSLQLLGSNLLKIKPQIVMENGKMRSNKKFKGTGEALYLKYVEATLEEFHTPDLDTVFITYTTCPDEIVEKIKFALAERGFKNIYVTHAGGTITSYCGQGCLGILYYNDGKI